MQHRHNGAWSGQPVSHRSVETPEPRSRHFYAEHRPPSKQVSGGLIPGIVVAPGPDVSYQFRQLDYDSLMLAFSARI